MGRILEHWRIPIAVLFSVVLVIGAYIIARGIESPPVAQASAETALLQAIAAKDSDSDGLPDWEEALYGTSPNNSDSNNLGMTDSEAVAKGLIIPKAISDISPPVGAPGSLDETGLPPAPADGTLTDTFAKTFFSLYLEAKQAKNGEDLTETDITNISNQAVNSLVSTVGAASDFKSANDLKISESGPDALKAFAVDAEAIIMKNASSNATTSEIAYLQYAVQGGDMTALPRILSIAKAYRDSATGLAALPVPQELAADDLALINMMARLGGIITDFARVNDDPLATMLALKQYAPATQALGTTFIHIGDLYKTAGISFSDGTPGASFVNLVAEVVNEQAAAEKP